MEGEESIVLLDNGSLRPDSVRSLRRIAAALGERLDERVQPVSLLHSSKIPAAELDGVEAQTWRRFLRGEAERGVRRILVLPLFFGPSSALEGYLPKVSAETLDKLGAARVEVEVGGPLVALQRPQEDAVAQALADLLEPELDTSPEVARETAVILVDHGSPVERVARCRDLVATQLRKLLHGRAALVIASSMERREGEEYAFNEPLLERALDDLRARGGIKRAVLSLMFISPGRHAGPGGDIESIAAASIWAREGGEIRYAPLVGESQRLIELLALRYQELRERLQ